ncbi:hypothetical protein TREMTM_A_00060 [Candidatus Tremblaya princeps]|uniref:Uncharacterized protein n=1 Tax=Tremblaya princeps TaxID=189385 RepID=A0A1C3K8W4_TREPR|nr:hypothetical protein TREMTM_A_00060 [Candidatus Tremblaya princeps]
MYCAWLGSASARRPTYSTQLALEGGARNCGNCSCDALRTIPMTTTAAHGARCAEAMGISRAPATSNTRTQHGMALRATMSA